MVFAHKQVTEELFKIFRLLLDSLSHILVVGADERIPEIPRILGENIVSYLEPHGSQVLDGKNRSRARVALAKGVNLPQARYKRRQMTDNLVHTQIAVIEFAFAFKIVI